MASLSLPSGSAFSALLFSQVLMWPRIERGPLLPGLAARFRRQLLHLALYLVELADHRHHLVSRLGVLARPSGIHKATPHMRQHAM